MLIDFIVRFLAGRTWIRTIIMEFMNIDVNYPITIACSEFSFCFWFRAQILMGRFQFPQQTVIFNGDQD